MVGSGTGKFDQIRNTAYACGYNIVKCEGEHVGGVCASPPPPPQNPTLCWLQVATATTADSHPPRLLSWLGLILTISLSGIMLNYICLSHSHASCFPDIKKYTSCGDADVATIIMNAQLVKTSSTGKHKTQQSKYAR